MDVDLLLIQEKDLKEYKKAVEELNVKIEAILLTHAHFDHIMSLDECRKYYNVPVYISGHERDWLSNPDFNGATSFRLRRAPITDPAEFEFEENKVEHKVYVCCDIFCIWTFLYNS